MTRHGTPLRQYLLAKKVDAGIAIESVLDFVPEYEQREAAVYCQFNWTDWSELDSRERAACIAHYRIHLAIEAHVSDAVTKKANRRKKHK